LEKTYFSKKIELQYSNGIDMTRNQEQRLKIKAQQLLGYFWSLS
jgi:hypothetical protein